MSSMAVSRSSSWHPKWRWMRCVPKPKRPWLADGIAVSVNSLHSSAYGGQGWSQRTRDHCDELGSIWASHQIDSEWASLKSVLLHRPGEELLVAGNDPNSVQMLAPVDLARAQSEHDQLAETYRSLEVDVHYVEPAGRCPPNQMFCADTFVMTPVGALLARPASTVRAGEERWVQNRLAALGVPIARSLTGTATFEGADLMWLDSETAIVGHGLRTNDEAIAQISTFFEQIGCRLIVVDMPVGTMHLMGMLRIIDKDLAVAWPRRTPFRAVRALEELGFEVVFLSDGDEQDRNRAINFVTLGPRKVLMVGGLTEFENWLERLGVECITTATDELSKAAGNVGCLTGVLQRQAAIPK
ncbi:MAG: dimethylarginine dimethylaminohydrolase family protein [Hyphomicrobiaceae bacterium]